ncbi:MAG: alpha/beta fold hydrolase [Nitrososphaera sp.]
MTSKDGTEIAFEKSGNGPALIIVSGSLADHQFYTPLADELAKHFMVYNFDRRGRGQSGNKGAYAVEREIEDVAALIDFAKESVCMYGHSAGSALALRAAASGLNITKVALADPPFTPRGRNDEEVKTEFAEEAARIQELHNEDDHRGSVKFFLSGMGLSDEDIEGILESPAGETMIDSAVPCPTIMSFWVTDLCRQIWEPKLKFRPLFLHPRQCQRRHKLWLMLCQTPVFRDCRSQLTRLHRPTWPRS